MNKKALGPNDFGQGADWEPTMKQAAAVAEISLCILEFVTMYFPMTHTCFDFDPALDPPFLV